MAQAGRTYGQRGGERHRSVGGLAEQRGEPPRHMNVGGGEHARVVERGEQPGGGPRAPDVEGIRVGHAGTAPRSRTSLSAPTSAPLGCQVNTPQRSPSTTGVSAPPMPRTKR